MRTDIEEILASKTVLLETRKRDGSWVPTPVSLVTSAGHTYFRSYDHAGKAKRLRNFDEVRATRCSMRGKPSGPTITGTARLLDGAEAETARSALAHRFPVLHGVVVPLTHRLKRWTTLHYQFDVSGV
jgi:PPOX class probable F420-dependent enzyme